METSPFERLREVCLSTPQAARELLPLIDFLEAFPEQVNEEELIHLVGVTALGIAKSSQGGVWDKREWMFLRGAPPSDVASPGHGWVLLPWGYLDELFGYLVVKTPEPRPTLELLLAISAPLLAWRRLETQRAEQNRVLALQVSRLNTLFDMTRHLGVGEPEGKGDVLHHFANTLAGEFMIQRVLVIDHNGTVLLGRGLGVIPSLILGEVLQGLINAKGLSFTAELKDQDNSHGFVYLANPAKGPLNEKDHLFMQTLLNITSSHLSALDMRESRLQSMKLEKDMELARNIQRRLLPHRPPEPQGWQCSAANLPYGAVGGDLYDLWVAKDSDKGDRLHVLVGDISGKGLPAALMMTQLSAFVRAMADRRVTDWGYLARRLNARMNEVRERNRYTTLFAASINPINGDLRYLNAGHNPPILVPGDGGPVRRLNATGPVIGLLNDVEFDEGHEVMEPGDVLLAFTDGLVEAEDEQGVELGDSRVVDVARNHQGASADEIFEQIFVATFYHIKDSGFRDDATLVVIKRCG
ncbi:MAG: PP2C family protein-serine/threonine phosphatase [Holophagaceae bacterium]|nr:PP2C family protein-serine/threonine phosphatase [Holophagaceae bacterium]